MNYEVSRSGDAATLQVAGELTASDRPEFDRVTATLFDGGAKNVSVHMSGLEYMDSAGLGMLVTLREQAQKRGGTVTLQAPRGDVKEMLELACFDRFFTITQG